MFLLAKIEILSRIPRYLIEIKLRYVNLENVCEKRKFYLLLIRIKIDLQICVNNFEFFYFKYWRGVLG